MGLIVELEGNEKVGKSTVTERLVKKLEEDGKRVLQLSFPSDGEIGKMIKEHLKGEIGLEPNTLHTMFELDKMLHKKILKNARKMYHYIIIDRYLLSGEVYARMRGTNEELIQTLQEELLKPTTSIYIHVPVEEIVNRKSKDVEDIYDNNLEVLKKVEQEYMKVAEDSERGIIVVDGTQEVGMLVEIIYIKLKHLERGYSICEVCMKEPSWCGATGKDYYKGLGGNVKECAIYVDIKQRYTEEKCDYCGDYTITRGSPYLADYSTGSNIKMCEECWKLSRKRGHILEDMEIGEF